MATPLQSRRVPVSPPPLARRHLVQAGGGGELHDRASRPPAPARAPPARPARTRAASSGSASTLHPGRQRHAAVDVEHHPAARHLREGAAVLRLLAPRARQVGAGHRLAADDAGVRVALEPRRSPVQVVDAADRHRLGGEPLRVVVGRRADAAVRGDGGTPWSAAAAAGPSWARRTVTLSAGAFMPPPPRGARARRATPLASATARAARSTWSPRNRRSRSPRSGSRASTRRASTLANRSVTAGSRRLTPPPPEPEAPRAPRRVSRCSLSWRRRGA